MANSGWSDGAWGSGFWGGFQDLDLTLTGVSGTLSLGTASGFQSANTQAIGFYNQVHLGSVSISIPANVDVTGVEGEVQSLTGWGSNGWGEFVYGGGVFADVGQTLPVTLDKAQALIGDVVVFTAQADAALSTTQSKFGGSSLELDGTGDRVQSTDITLGTDSYTWETFAYFNNLSSTQCIWDAGENVGASQNPVVYITSTNLQLTYSGGTYINAAHGMSAGQWHHIAIVRDGTQLEAFIDGVSLGTNTYLLGSGATNHVLGGNFAGTFTMDGYLDESRLTRRAVYTGNFTPPTQAFSPNPNDIWLLHYDGADGSTDIENSAPGSLISPTGGAVVSPTGVSGSTLLESVLVGAGAIVGEDGMVGSVGLGDESVVGTCNFTLTGVSGSTVVGDESIETDTGAPVTGVPGMTASLGDETTFISFTAKPTGFSLTSTVGQETVTGDSLLSLTGVAASGNISTVILWGRIVPSQNATWTEEAA